MSVGLPVTKDSLDANAGSIAYTLEKVFRQAEEMKAFLNRYSAADLEAQFGFTVEDAATLKSAFDEAEITRQTYEANKTFLTKLSGLGDIS